MRKNIDFDILGDFLSGPIKGPRHVGDGQKRAAKRLAAKRKANKAIPDGVPYHRQHRLWKDGAGRIVGHNGYRA